jgi:hypothetical protein
MAGEDSPRIYRTAEDRGCDWNGAVADPVVGEDAWRQWRAEREVTDWFIAGFADVGVGPGVNAQFRDILVAQIAEYARQCVHADLLRERIDGRLGQWLPRAEAAPGSQDALAHTRERPGTSRTAPPNRLHRIPSARRQRPPKPRSAAPAGQSKIVYRFFIRDAGLSRRAGGSCRAVPT